MTEAMNTAKALAKFAALAVEETQRHRATTEELDQLIQLRSEAVVDEYPAAVRFLDRIIAAHGAPR